MLTLAFRLAPLFRASSLPANTPAIAPTCDARLTGPPGTGRWKSRAVSTPKAVTMYRSRPAFSCGSRPSITAKSDIPGTSGRSVSRWNNGEEDLQGDAEQGVVPGQLWRPAARLGADEWHRPAS